MKMAFSCGFFAKQFFRKSLQKGGRNNLKLHNSPRSKTLFSILWKKFSISFLFKIWRFFKHWTFRTLKRLDGQVWNFRIWLNAWSWVTSAKMEVSERKKNNLRKLKNPSLEAQIPWGWDLWPWRWNFGLKAWGRNLSLKSGIWISRLGYGPWGWDMGLEVGGGRTEEEEEKIPCVLKPLPCSHPQLQSWPT